MARDILLHGTKVEHRPSHDLESLFFVFIWICSNYDGPGNSLRSSKKRKSLPIQHWVDTDKLFSEIANIKLGHCVAAGPFKTWILDYYLPYFEDLKDCSEELRQLFDINRPNATHKEMLAILERAFQGLKDEARVIRPVDASDSFILTSSTKSAGSGEDTIIEDEGEYVMESKDTNDGWNSAQDDDGDGDDKEDSNGDRNQEEELSLSSDAGDHVNLWPLSVKPHSRKFVHRRRDIRFRSSSPCYPQSTFPL